MTAPNEKQDSTDGGGDSNNEHEEQSVSVLDFALAADSLAHFAEMAQKRADELIELADDPRRRAEILASVDLKTDAQAMRDALRLLEHGHRKHDLYLNLLEGCEAALGCQEGDPDPREPDRYKRLAFPITREFWDVFGIPSDRATALAAAAELLRAIDTEGANGFSKWKAFSAVLKVYGVDIEHNTLESYVRRARPRT